MEDLYEYAAAKNKRAGVTLDVDLEERAIYEPSRSGVTERDDVDDDMETLRRKISTTMEGDLGVVDSEDDEDIDSDEAFEGESEEERFGNFKFGEKVRRFTTAVVLMNECIAFSRLNFRREGYPRKPNSQ